MGFMFVKKMTLLFLLVSAFLFSASFAADPGSKFLNREDEEVWDEESGSTEENDAMIHERLLSADSGDYGKVNPAPKLAKPPFKVIQN
ncbi:hypothetical protein SLEP1_g50163 [Rubroshorea leprosula]|uniref:Uncharacterized protein n=1 Tax=Rubroshorea leprosula TaxID=152421 RepID=A0AAV5LZX3_9ROSI|nr:hypothetical protein SLEP1_g50163 [Rubroshorea leprosula]